MPIYCFKAKDGEVVERKFRINRVPDRIVLEDGRLASRSVVSEIKQMFGPQRRGWPLTCVASGVHPDQAGELRDYLANAGVPTEVTSEGDPRYRNANHRRKALAVRGIHDRNSFS